MFSKEDEFDVAEQYIIDWIVNDWVDPTGGTRKKPKLERTRTPKPECWDSSWAQLILNPETEFIDTPAGRTFRRRFRVPFVLFRDHLVKICDEHNIFNEQRKSRIPLEFKILLSLRILGRGNCADDIQEFIPSIGHSTINFIFKEFVPAFVHHFYHIYVTVPEGNEMKKVMEVYARLGLPGAMGSMDCTHVRWERCPVEYTNHCIGKEGYPTLAFQVVVDHTKRIHHVSRYFFGACNDKQITNNDSYPIEIMQGKYKNVEFNLRNSKGEIVRVKGGYLLVDGGYQKFSCFIDPMHTRFTKDTVLWSEWVESVRKDVECTFGILKVSLISVVVYTIQCLYYNHIYTLLSAYMPS